LTAERFIPYPFSERPGERLYRTGDLARYRPDGNLEFLGRIDHQVKVRGFRIELGEVEAVLGGRPGVRQAVVIVREDIPGNKRLVAYVIPVDKSVPVLEELRDFIKAKLPDYMVPSAFVLLDALPLTPNGKVDRRALPPPDGMRPELAAIYVPPRTETERTIAAIWQQALGVETVGVHGNFFDLGGHSLLLLQVHTKLREAFNQELSVMDLFKHPTISSLAQYLRQEPVEPPMAPLSRIRAEARRASIRQLIQFRQTQ
jgi:acyl carrier protein